MLPSTGYFKDIICPFYDNAFCERPYCHFRHSKKDGQNNDGIENDAILQQLVSEAVKKVLKHTDRTSASVPSNVATEILPSEIKDETSSNSTITRKATYNPTPIAELKKFKSPDDGNGEGTIELRPRRHIPVPYTPHRPLTSAIKRMPSNTGNNKDIESFNIINTEIAATDVKYLPGSHEIKRPDPYFPQGSGTSNGVYLPGSVPQKSFQAYNPMQNSSTPSNVSYTPTDISNIDNVRTNNTKYEPTGVSGGLKYNPTAKVKDENNTEEEHKKSALLYEPVSHKKPKFPCFSSDEDEPKTKKIKAADDSEDTIHDMNGLDDLEPEFEILGQILDEEDDSQPSVGNEEIKANDSEKHKKEKSSDTAPLDKKRDKEKSHSKSDLDKPRSSKHSSSTKSSRHKSDSKSKDRDIKSSHKSRDHDKEKPRVDTKDNDKRKEKSSKSEHKSHHSSSSKSNSHSSGHKSKSSSHSKHKESRDKYKSSSKDKRTDSKSKEPESRSSEKKHKDSDSKEGTPKKKVHLKEDNSGSEASLIEDYDENVEEPLSELSESDEDAITKECMKIFEEYTPTLQPKVDTNNQPKVDIDEPCIVLSKKRVSHTNDKVIINTFPKPIAKPNYKVNAAQAMANRLLKVREYHNAKALAKSDVPNALGGSKLRIAHVPNVSTMLSAKKVISKPGVDKSEASSSTTIVQTTQKGTNRVAHVPNDKFADRPGVLEPLSSKIPVNLRSTYLNMMIDETLKIYLSPSDAYNRAQQEELATSKKCTAIPIYKNSAVLAVRRLRKEFEESGSAKKNSIDNAGSKISHSQVLIGKLNQTSWSIENKYKKVSELYDELKGIKFFQNVTKWILTEEQLQQNGFPRPHPSGERGRAKIYVENTKQKPPKGNIRPCCRCKKEFTVDKKGFASVKEDCIYHPNNKYRFRGDVKYQCCQQDGSSDGCTIAQTHVFEYIDYQNLKGYVKTLPKDKARENFDYGVYALDCEMCYTTHGLDLTRITVINSTCKIVYETLIKPLHPIIDYNTRYSGITEEQMEGVSTTLLEVQATLLHMFDSKTILVGHSLESDFKALKLIHDTVIDTSVLFPHKMGPPYKRALRNLSSEYLKKIIQNSVDGHDSTEDATVCMELIQWKLKEELKIR